MAIALTVYKLGGSLLDLPGLADRLRDMLGQAGPERKILVVGGGPTADAVRAWDRIHHLGAERAHRIAIAAMDLNAAMIRELLTDSGLTVGKDARRPNGFSVVVPDLLPEVAECSDSAPAASWNVTSDSLAAWLAGKLHAPRIVLLKSVPAPGDGLLATALQSGHCDPEFTRYLQPLSRVDWVNLRDSVRCTPLQLPSP